MSRDAILFHRLCTIPLLDTVERIEPSNPVDRNKTIMFNIYTPICKFQY